MIRLDGVHVRFAKEMIEEVDRVIDPTIGQTRSMFIREAVKERLNKLNALKAVV